MLEKKNIFLLKCGRFGGKLKQKLFLEYFSRFHNNLVLHCKVTIKLPGKLSPYEYAAPAEYLPPFNRNIRVDAFKHTWVLDNFQPWFEKEQQDFVVYSDVFFKTKENSTSREDDSQIQLAMALSGKIVDDTCTELKGKNAKFSHFVTDNDMSFKKQKFTLYLYPVTLDDTDVQFVLYVFYKSNFGFWNMSK